MQKFSSFSLFLDDCHQNVQCLVLMIKVIALLIGSEKYFLSLAPSSDITS